MAHRRPNEYRIELGVTLRLTEVPMHLLLKAVSELIGLSREGEFRSLDG